MNLFSNQKNLLKQKDALDLTKFARIAKLIVRCNNTPLLNMDVLSITSN